MTADELEKLTKAELIKKGEELGIELNNGMLKREMIERLLHG